MKALGMADVGIELFDEQTFFTVGHNGSTDIAAEQDFGLPVVKMEIARGVQVVSRNGPQRQAVEGNVHSLVGDRDESIGIAAEMRNETCPQPTDVAAHFGVEFKPQGQR